LRIWPLYYFVVFIAFALVPMLYSNFQFLHHIAYYGQLIEQLPTKMPEVLVLFLAFVPNLALVFFGAVATAAQAWSVGVEEQFYIFWPWVLRLRRAWLLPAFVGIIVLKLLLGFTLARYTGRYSGEINYLWGLNRFELMALGAIAAVWVYDKNEWFCKWLRPKSSQVLLIIAITVALFIALPDFVLSVLFVLLISSLAISGRAIIGNPISNYLGKISYGLYMYHPLWLFLGFNFAAEFFELGSLAFHILYYGLVIGGTLVLSQLSYQFLESPFLKKKESFAKVKSGEDPAKNFPSNP